MFEYFLIWIWIRACSAQGTRIETQLQIFIHLGLRINSAIEGSFLVRIQAGLWIILWVKIFGFFLM